MLRLGLYDDSNRKTNEENEYINCELHRSSGGVVLKEYQGHLHQAEGNSPEVLIWTRKGLLGYRGNGMCDISSVIRRTEVIQSKGLSDQPVTK